ncbi:B3/B4 domain-containing protein [Jeotgalibacillus haloalkalitolerans]|uniref:Phenylalanine--tRNA ligase beta subunit-related protein n=1 Tax=Jeotgalibacillus haloalkalitolerans TaxID=3104292 RepID=A0ABU5KPF3_9BACL|nr:phenylalanine--tRNA ligase beta subunit-related protein [Jeotgalibacillus sp. HH7-29]MDZ5713139.1 phenylalanine--tRNA ligase beta subunit-related protein [Jeotgalibacillus sp. HH7-29]
MKISVHSSLKSLSFGIIHYKNTTVSESPQMLKGRLQLFQESLFFDLKDQKPADFEGIAEWRQLFKQFGKDPNRYRPSTEALLRRIAKQNYLPSTNSAVDLNNFFSLQYETPLGIYDTQNISGDIEIRLGSDQEQFEGLNGRMNSAENLIIAADSNGPFGSPCVDSARTAVSKETNDALHIVYFRPSLPKEEQEKMLHSLKDMFIQVNGGTATAKLV